MPVMVRLGFDRLVRGCASRVATLAVASLAAGCGSSDNRNAPDGGSPLPGAVVTVHTGVPPALLAIRDEASLDWRLLTPSTASTFDIVMPSGPYRIAVVCAAADRDGVAVTEYARTPEDDATLVNVCDPATPFDVTGTVAQSGSIAFAGNGEGAAGATNWFFDFQVSPGTFDLVLLPGDFSVAYDGIAIRRDIAITGDLDLGVIDLTKGMQPLVPMRVTGITVAAGDVLRSSTLLEAGGAFVVLGRPAFDQSPGPKEWNAALAPAGVLRATDHQYLSVGANRPSTDGSSSSFRSIRREVHLGDPAEVTLPDPFDSVAFEMSPDRLTATWSKLPGESAVSLTRTEFSDDFSSDTSYELELTARFIAATGATTATLEVTDLPGFKAAWLLDPTVLQDRDFTATRRLPTGDTAAVGVGSFIDPTTTARVIGALPTRRYRERPVTGAHLFSGVRR